jgi:uroporphyrinogen-III synthase
VSVPPLTGRSVVVTRALGQASGLADRLAGLGATVVELPVIAIEEPADGGAALATAAHRLASGAYQWVAFTSSNAASRFLAVLGDRAVPASVRWSAVGVGTAHILAQGGFPPELVPEVSVAEALAEVFPTVDPLHGRSAGEYSDGLGTVLFPRAETVHGALAAGLRTKGWLVDEVVAYRTVAGDPGPEAVAAAGRADAIAFTSSSTVERTVELLGSDGIPPVVASIGPVTSNSARTSGLEVAVEADPHTIDALVDGLVEALERSKQARPLRHGNRNQYRQQQR